MTNRYPGTCAACGVRVPAGNGTAFKLPTGKWGTRHDECPDITREIAAADAWLDHMTNGPIRAAWAARVPVADVERGSFYDVTTFVVVAPAGVTASQFRSVISRGDGQSMYSFGTFGGYSTIGSVVDNGNGTFNVQSVYHIGD